MSLDKLIDDCSTLENTVAILIKANAAKLQELNKLHSLILDTTQSNLDNSINTECELLQQLDSLRAKRDSLEIEIKQFTHTNSILAELVNLARKTESDDDILCRFGDTYVGIAECINEFEKIRIDSQRFNDKIDELGSTIVEETNELRELIKDSQILNVELHKNDNILRVLTSQNKFLEQQFDLILNQLPWEPLADSYIEKLRQYSNRNIRELADVLQIQANEIVYLNDTLDAKKSVKLKVLEDFAKELEEFAKKREEAALVDGRSF